MGSDDYSRIDELVDAIVSASPTLDRTDRAIALSLYRALAGGSPVSHAELAGRAGVRRERVAATLDSWPGVFRDEKGRVIGFWGLALTEMAHHLKVSGVPLYAWCAWDPLFIGPLLGEPVEVESTCPVTREAITLTATPEGVADVRPASATLSFLAPDGCWGDDVITVFCRFVLLFASEEAGRKWTAERDGTFLIALEEAFELGRRVNEARFGLTSPARS